METNRYRFLDAVEDKENIIFRETRMAARTKNHPNQQHHSKPGGGDTLPFHTAESPPPSVHTWTPPASASKTKKKNNDNKKATKETTEPRDSGAKKSPSPPSSEDEGFPQKPQPPRMADEDTVFSCLTCFKRFDNVCDLQLHVKTHKVYPCAFCGAEYKDHRAFRLHLFSHPSEPEESASSH